MGARVHTAFSPQTAFQEKGPEPIFQTRGLPENLEKLFSSVLFQGGDRGCGPKEKGAKGFSVEILSRSEI